jgi:hypothetical protein
MVFRFNPTASDRFGKGRKENFVALEVNQTWGKGDAGEMVLRPQIQIEFSEKWKVGFVGVEVFHSCDNKQSFKW